MLEFPQLFGSSYVLPAIIAVVVLLLALLLLMLRRRRRMTVVSDKISQAATGETSGPVQSSSPRGSRAAAPIKTTLAAEADGAVPLSVNDPLKQTLDRILEGWGDLAPEDLKRLTVFRQEKVLAAIAALEVPKELKGSRYAHVRLNQLRAYAASLRESETIKEKTGAPKLDPEPELPASEGDFWASTPPSEAAAPNSEEGATTDHESAPETSPVEETPAEVEEKPAEEVLLEEEVSVEEAPAEDEIKKLASLTPEQLAEVLESTESARVKIAIIDQLEHLASPAALDIIRRCLDDPDPVVQLHALEAADRLLSAT